MNLEKFSNIVGKFKNTKNQKGNTLNMHYLSIKQNNEIYSHSFNNRQEPSDTRSISKTALTLLAGILMDLSDQGKYPHFSLETYVFPIIKDAVNLRNLENKAQLEKVQVKHLITHTVGFDKVLLMRGDIVDLDPFTYLDHVINQPINHEPGEYYLYSNAGFYILSAVLEEFIGEGLLEFADRYLFAPLAIKDYKWDKYGNYLAGATKLWMHPEDLLKIGDLIMKGNPRIDQMLEATTYTKDLDNPDHILRRYAYASGIWLGKEPIFLGHGTDGQTLIMIPEKDTIIVTLAHESDINTIHNILNDIILEL